MDDNKADNEAVKVPTVSDDPDDDVEDDAAAERSARRWAEREAFFFNHGANICFLSLLMAFNVIMGCWGLWQFLPPNFSTDSDVLRVTLPIARVGGRIVTWNAALIFLSGSKYMWTALRRTPLALGFPIDNVMPHYHRIIAVTIIVMGAVVHTVAQVVNYATRELEIVSTPVWTLGNGQLATKQLLITGVFLVVVFAAFFVTTLSKVRHTTLGFRIFWWTHVVGIVSVVPLLLIHGTFRGMPMTTYFMAVPLVVYGCDVLLRCCMFAPRGARVVHASAHDGGRENVVKIEIQCDGFAYSTGQYADLQIPEVSRTEWHPFTIASAPNAEGRVVFYIKAVGQWTDSLYELVSQNKDALTTIGVRGPFGAPAQNHLVYRHIVVIGSGIGVTPLLSVWHHLVTTGAALVDPRTGSRRRLSEHYDREKAKLPDAVSDKLLIERANVSFVGVAAFDRPLTTLRMSLAYYASVLESMTVNVCLFVFFFWAETIVFCVWIFEKDVAAASMLVVTSSIAMFVFGSRIILSTYVYGWRYLKSFVFYLELGIVVLDGVALVSSATSSVSFTREEAGVYFSSFAAFCLLHSVRIFHIFYATATPPTDKQVGARQVDKIYSIEGIWVSQTYKSMEFAVQDLVETTRGLSPAYSLKLFCTRDKKEDVLLLNPFDERDQHELRAGRPDWESLMTDAIERAHGDNEPVGVFFCGGPAISSVLQTIGQKVTAVHQHVHGGSCSCRIRVHKENF